MTTADGPGPRRDPKDPALVVTLLAMLAAAAWTIAVSSGCLEAIDERVFDFVFRHRTPAGVSLMIAVSYLGSEYVTPLLILGTAWLVSRRSRRWAWFLLAVVVSSTLWQIGLKHLLEVPRPPPLFPYWQEAGYPSGHALTGVCFGWAGVAYLRWRFPGWPKGWGWAAAVILIAWPVVVGASRVYLAAHWSSDIVGGILLGVMHFSGAWHYVGHGLKREGTEPPEVPGK